MKFGKLFKAYAKYTDTDLNTFSANRCSELSHRELITMAKHLYGAYIFDNYTHYTHHELTYLVYNALIRLEKDMRY